MPCPFSRKTCPLCVVSGIFRRTEPVIVGTCASPPSTAVVTGTATFACRSLPWRSNTACGLQPDAQIQIARRTAVAAGFSFAGGAHARAVLDPDRDAHVDAARVAALLDRHAAGRAVIRLFERQLDFVLDVAALLRARRAPLPRRGRLRAAPPPPKNVRKKSENGSSFPNSSCISSSVIVRYAARPAHVDVPGAAARRTAAERVAAGEALALLLRLFVLAPVRPELVVLPPLVRVAEHLVRLVDFLEARLGRLVARIDVRVVLSRQLPVRLLEFLVRRGLGDAERLVVILEFQLQPHHLADTFDLQGDAPPGLGPLGILVHQRANPLDRFRNREQPLDTRQVDPAFVDEVLDQAKALEFVVRIDAHAADRPRRADEPEPLVLAQRLGVHVEQARSHADKVEICFFHIEPADPM